MKLLNLNLGIKISNTEKVIELIKNIAPDLICFQEVVRHLEEGVHEQFQTKHLIEKAFDDRYPYEFFGALFSLDAIRKGDNTYLDYGGFVEQGNQVLSTHPINNGFNRFFHKAYAYEHDWANWKQEDHGRALLSTEIDLAGQILKLHTIHGIWTEDKLGDERTEKECRFIAEQMADDSVPQILIGDLNLQPHAQSLTVLNERFRNLTTEYGVKRTLPTFENDIDKGDLIVDYAFVNEKIKVINFEVLERDISDHFPLLLEFEILN